MWSACASRFKTSNDMSHAGRHPATADPPAVSHPGYLVVISAPSGGGKTSVIRALLADRRPDCCYSVSMTTRPPRPAESNGRDYIFATREEFVETIRNNGLIEWAEVHNHLYGTPRAAVEQALAAGKFIFMDIDVQGGLNVKRQYGSRAILIFIKPPSLDSLRERLQSRNTDSPAQIDVRLQAARRELDMAEQYDHVIVNHDLQASIKQVAAIVDSYRRPVSC